MPSFFSSCRIFVPANKTVSMKMQIREQSDQVSTLKALLEEFREKNSLLQSELNAVTLERDQLLEQVKSMEAERDSNSRSNAQSNLRSKVTSRFPYNRSSSSSSSFSSTEDIARENECSIQYTHETTRWNHDSTLQVDTNDTENRMMHLMLHISGTNSTESIPDSFHEHCKLLTDIVSGARSLADLPRHLTSRCSGSNCHLNHN